jgi:hypothetical protein
LFDIFTAHLSERIEVFVDAKRHDYNC